MAQSVPLESAATMGADTRLAEYTLADVAKHNRKDDIWIAIHGQGRGFSGVLMMSY